MPYLVGYITPQDYGATGNGGTDDTTAIQAALNAASAAGGGTVYFPAGTYLTSSALTVPSSIILLGSGVNKSIIHQSSTTANGFTATTTTALKISDLQLVGPSSGTGIGIAISGAPTSYVYLRNVRVDYFGSDGINVSDPIISRFDDVVSNNNGGHGFNIGGATPGAGGTSCSFTACYGISNTQAGFYLNNLQYSHLSGCGSDSNRTGYYLNQCIDVCLTGCGTESNVVGTSPYVGNGFVINGGSGVTLVSCFDYANPAISFWVTGTASKVQLITCGDNSPAVGATNSIKVDSGSSATVISPTASSPVSYSSTTQVLNDGSGNLQTYGEVLAKTSGTVALAAMQAATATNINFIVTSTGIVQIGPGTAGVDTQIARTGAGAVTVTNMSAAHGAAWLVDGNVIVGGTAGLGDNGVGEIQLTNATTIPTTNPTGGGVLYVSGGALVYRGSSGTVTTVAPA